MKEILTNITIFVIVLLLFYLGAAFIELTFDISKWAADTRFMVAVIGTGGAAIIMMVNNMDKK